NSPVVPYLSRHTTRRSSHSASPHPATANNRPPSPVRPFRALLPSGPLGPGPLLPPTRPLGPLPKICFAVRDRPARTLPPCYPATLLSKYPPQLCRLALCQKPCFAVPDRPARPIATLPSEAPPPPSPLGPPPKPF